MRGRQVSCCFTGHRPGKLPWRYDEGDPRCLALKRRIADAVEAAYQEGVTAIVSTNRRAVPWEIARQTAREDLAAALEDLFRLYDAFHPGRDI